MKNWLKARRSSLSGEAQGEEEEAGGGGAHGEKVANEEHEGGDHQGDGQVAGEGEGEGEGEEAGAGSAAGSFKQAGESVKGFLKKIASTLGKDGSDERNSMLQGDLSSALTQADLVGTDPKVLERDTQEFLEKVENYAKLELEGTLSELECLEKNAKGNINQICRTDINCRRFAWLLR